MIHDAIVVGAGLSGLVCAARLVERGASAIVLEARDRIGGRLATARVGGATLDLGGQWISAGQTRLLALAAELGVESFPQRRDGRPAIEPPASWLARFSSGIAALRAMRTIKRLDAATVDDVSLDEFLATTIRNPRARSLIAMHAELVFAIEPAKLSLRYYLRVLAATDHFSPRGPDLPGGGREHRFVGGSQELAIRLAARLGDRVHLASPVRTIVRAGDHLRVDDREARAVVIAVPPWCARAIACDWPTDTRRYLDRAVAGHVVKSFAVYPRAFWRDRGASGECYRPHDEIRAIVGLESPAGETAALVAFVVGDAARTWRDRDPAARRASVLDAFAAQFGEAARAPIDTIESSWTDGCVATLAPGDGDLAWGAAIDGIVIAGTESATRWPGYMEGAVEAGERAADRVRE